MPRIYRALILKVCESNRFRNFYYTHVSFKSARVLEGCWSCGHYCRFNDNITPARNEKMGLRLRSPYVRDRGGIRSGR